MGVLYAACLRSACGRGFQFRVRYRAYQNNLPVGNRKSCIPVQSGAGVKFCFQCLLKNRLPPLISRIFFEFQHFDLSSLCAFLMTLNYSDIWEFYRSDWNSINIYSNEPYSLQQNLYTHQTNDVTLKWSTHVTFRLKWLSPIIVFCTTSIAVKNAVSGCDSTLAQMVVRIHPKIASRSKIWNHYDLSVSILLIVLLDERRIASGNGNSNSGDENTNDESKSTQKKNIECFSIIFKMMNSFAKKN